MEGLWGICTRIVEQSMTASAEVLRNPVSIFNNGLCSVKNVMWMITNDNFIRLDNGQCLGWRESKNKPYQWIHYNETLLRAKNFGCGLVHLGKYIINSSIYGSKLYLMPRVLFFRIELRIVRWNLQPKLSRMDINRTRTLLLFHGYRSIVRHVRSWRLCFHH